MSGGFTVALVLVVLAAVFEGISVFPRLPAFWFGFLAILGSGCIDDARDLRPLSKGVLQIGSALVTVSLLIVGGLLPPNPKLIGLLVFWVVGIINAFNLLDNMDGLTGGVDAIASLSVGFLIISPAQAGRLLTVVLAGALLGFLIHNFSPARVFLGDAGSHIVGFTLAVLPLYSLDLAPPDWRSAVACAVIFLIPVGDTVFVTLRRIRESRPFYIGGRDHSSHWLLSLGLSEGMVAVIFYLAAVSSAIVAYLILHSK